MKIVFLFQFSGMNEITAGSDSKKANVQSVLLLTDGLANHGVKTKDGILAEMKKLQNRRKVFAIMYSNANLNFIHVDGNSKNNTK